MWKTFTRDVSRIGLLIHVNVTPTPKDVTNAEVAQLVELLPSKQVVESSSLFFRSKDEFPYIRG